MIAKQQALGDGRKLSSPVLFHKIAKIEVNARNSAIYRDFGEECYVSEPVFIPKKHEHEQDEDDGYIITQVLDGAKNETYFAILDAKDLSILAKVFTPTMPWTFHSYWHQY